MAGYDNHAWGVTKVTKRGLYIRKSIYVLIYKPLIIDIPQYHEPRFGPFRTQKHGPPGPGVTLRQRPDPKESIFIIILILQI